MNNTANIFGVTRCLRNPVRLSYYICTVPEEKDSLLQLRYSMGEFDLVSEELVKRTKLCAESTIQQLKTMNVKNLIQEYFYYCIFIRIKQN